MIFVIKNIYIIKSDISTSVRKFSYTYFVFRKESSIRRILCILSRIVYNHDQKLI